MKGLNDEDFDVIKCDPEKIGLKKAYLFEEKDLEYASITAKIDESLKLPSFLMAEIKGVRYFALDDDFFNSGNREFTFTFRAGDIDEGDEISYYLVYQR